MAKTKNNQVAVIGNNQSIPDLIEFIKTQEKALEHIAETNYRNSTDLKEPFGDIKTETKIENLIKAWASIKGKEKAYNEAAKDLELKAFPQFVRNGNTAEDWKHNIMLRIAVINNADEIKKLKEFKDKLSKFVSEEDQKAMLIKEMADYFKK